MYLFTRLLPLMLLMFFFFACREKDYGIKLDLKVSVWAGYSKEATQTNHKIASQSELQSDFKQVFEDTNKLFRNELEEDKNRECVDDEACPIKIQLTGKIDTLPGEINGHIFDGIIDDRLKNDFLKVHIGRNKLTAYSNVMIVERIKVTRIDPATGQSKLKTLAGLTRQDHGGIFIAQKYLHRPYNTLAHELGHLLMNYDSAPEDLFDDTGHLECDSSFDAGPRTYKIDDRYFLTGCKQEEGKSCDYILFHNICQYMLDTPSDVRDNIKTSGGEWEQVDVPNDAGKL